MQPSNDSDKRLTGESRSNSTSKPADFNSAMNDHNSAYINLGNNINVYEDLQYASTNVSLLI